MRMYLEQSAGGIQVENFDTEEEEEDFEIQEPQMQSTKDEEHMEDPMVNTILISDLQMINKFLSNNYNNEGFGMQRFEDDLSWVSVESIELFA